MFKYLVPLIIVFSVVLHAQEEEHVIPKTNQASDATSVAAVAAVRSELEAMFVTDQSNRMKFIELEKKYGQDSIETKTLWSKQKSIDAENIQRLEKIIAEYGWPGSSQFGKKGSMAAFLILQHSGISYQKKYLPLVKAAAAKGELQASSLALLEDRIRVRQGQKQIYGSQVSKNDVGEWEPEPLEDESKVDVLRAGVVLGPISEYLQGFADRSGGRVSPKWIKKREKEPRSKDSVSP